MTNISHKNPHYALRIEETTMDKLKYIAGHNGRSANKEIEQLILAHIASYERVHGPIVLTEEDYVGCTRDTDWKMRRIWSSKP